MSEGTVNVTKNETFR